jgi:sec-independent protein translocase protein TatA
MPFQLGLPEILLVLVIALVFLGPKRLPEAGNAIGRGMREFRAGISGHDDERPAPPAFEPPPTAYVPPPSYVPPVDSTGAYSPPASYHPPGAPPSAEPAGRHRHRSRPKPDGDPVPQPEATPVAAVHDPEDVGSGDAVGERPLDQAG